MLYLFLPIYYLAAATTAAATAAMVQPNILFLMCDSMDGRVLDPTSPVSERLEMPNLRKLASQGTNFINTYAASPQCVPSRTTMFAGRRIDQTRTWSNEQGLAGIPSTGRLDTECLRLFDLETCTEWQKNQNVSATLVDSLREVNCEACLYGKVDVGAGILQEEVNARANGYHTGPSLSILTRTADIRKATKPDPLSITNDYDNHVHQEDWKMIPKCIEFLKNAPKAGTFSAADKSWMLYCSINIPHPAFNTNSTWLKGVNVKNIPTPTWLPDDQFHPADSYMSQSKNVWRNYTKQEIHKVRKTYYAMCVETDYMLGTVIDALKKYEHYNNTYIIFLSDHGEMNMEHRQVWKNSMYEASERVPLIIAPPPSMTNVHRGQLVSNLTSLLDIYPTLLEMAQQNKIQINMPKFLSGHSLFSFLYNDGTKSKSDVPYPNNRIVTAEYFSNMGNTGSFMVRSKQWKYIAFGRHSYDPTYTPQLFNLLNDPDELNDVSLMYPQVCKELDDYLISLIGNYYTLDNEVVQNDIGLYRKFFISKYDNVTLRKKFDEAYTGFDDNDWNKINKWLKNG
jgi:arylsulfatase K